MPLEQWVTSARRLAARAPVLKATRPVFDRAVGLAGRKRGVRLNAPAGDSFRFDASLFRNDYAQHEPAVYEWIMTRLRPGAAFYDVGAWIGLFSLGAAQRVGPSGRVVAVEPSPDTARLLRRHVALNGFEDRTTVLETLVGDEVGTQTFFTKSGLDMSNSIAAQTPGAERRELPMTTLDEVVAATGLAPDFVKIDVEGYEWEAVRGLEETIERHRPILLVERSGAGLAVAELLAPVGYEAFAFDPNRDALERYEDQAVTNLLILPREVNIR